MLTLNDGRTELWQWDTGRKLTVDADCSQVHFSNKVFGRSVDVDVVDGVAIIPDILLQTDKDLTAWAFVGTSENGYTKISKVFKVNRRNKPADYVFTPTDQTSLEELIERLDAIEESQDPDAIKNAVEDYLENNPVEAPVQSVNGYTGKVELTAEDVGAISQDDLQEATNEALAQAKASGEFDGQPGQPGRDGVDGKDGYTPIKGIDYFDGQNGQPGKDGKDGKDGIDGQPGKDGYTPQKGIDYFDGKDGLNGKDGVDGYTPVKGVDYFDGKDGQNGSPGKDGSNGKDGVSATHSWNGTTLTVTSASGTSSADLKGAKGDKGEKGAKGDKGDQGIQGEKGEKGETGAAGSNGADGKDGANGYTPVKGVDYWTEADRQEMEAYIASELAKRGQLKPEFANSIEECTDTSKLYVLPDGYIYAYVYGESEAVTYTNILDGTELHLNKRINSSGNYVDLNGYVSTDYLKLAPGDVVRVNRNISAASNATYDKNRVIAYNDSKTIAYGNDAGASYYSPVTDEGNGVYSFVFGKVYNTFGDASSGTKMLTTIVSEGYMRLNIGLSSSAITEADVDDLVITLNEPISAGTIAGYDWRNTGLPFVPADYEDRIRALEKAVSELDSVEASSNISTPVVFAPSPQLPADGSDEADFNAENMTAQEIYNDFDALCEKYPNYITKETLGKDAGNTLDVNRYVLCRHYYKAWQRVNYPKMYAWVNGATVLYSRSVSPRIGDTLYTTAYIGTAKGTVTAVSNANQTRTVGGVVYERDSTKDVEPTLVFTSIIGNAKGSTVYNQNQTTATTVSTITAETMTGTNGISYVRYPMGDRSRTMERSAVVTIGANEHGFTPDPRIPAIICARLAKDLCECRNADNPFLNHLKNEVMLIIVPVINPYGFNLGTAAGYYNKNGVNINRNYDCPGWGNLTDAGPQGDYGGSEIETQYFMNTISEPKSAVAVSVHGLGYSTNGGNTLTHYQGNNFNQRKIAEIAEVMAANYNLQFTNYGTTPPATNQGGKSPAYITWAGAVGGLIEMQAEGADTQRNTAYVLEADYTLLLQCVRMWLSDYEETT